ncbi:alpha/beta hydrolase [Brachybacterium sp. NBEC-018]|uniref:alpha/beta hydrolase n=1 Tax=Brachybacterium sp. NBEC-018 TaxID=2996004 RepID=UPI0021756CA1|nr:alpha/beta hydrolase [Brachybacterium sp. NBEC-018]UVY85388.1 alpha/beta hydrolase [Brachybacterium sp. NBEC-018]
MPAAMRVRRADRHHRTREDVRRRLEQLTLRPEPTHPPRRSRKGVRISTEQRHGWTVHRVAPRHAEPAATVLQLHGGAWMNEAAPAHWRLAQQLAVEARVEVLLPVYPLVQHGGTAETVVPVVARLAEEAARPLVLLGDSAGGTIALSAALLLRDRGRPADLTVLIAPALDLRMQNPEIDAVQPHDPWLVKTGQLELTERWIGEHGEDPVLNPFLGDLRGLGPLLLFSGTRDLLNPDTRLFVRRARREGAPIEYHEAPGQIHVHPLLPTPEGREARARIVRAVRETAGGEWSRGRRR